MVNKFSIMLIVTCVLFLQHTAIAAPVFDVHLHYNKTDVESFGPLKVIQTLKHNNVPYAVVTSRPPELVLQLQREAPAVILPMLGLYQTIEAKSVWFNDETLPAQIESSLKKGGWRAIGEVHIFAAQRYKPVFRKIVQLAKNYQLPLMIHGDPAVIDAIYEFAPGHPVIWAHAGTYPYPDLLADYLTRYPALHVDLSVRDERIAPQGKLHDSWYDFLLSYPTRVMVGVDTYSTSRWQNYGQAIAQTRVWLSQLPDNIAKQVMYENAYRVLLGSGSGQ